MWLIFNSLQMFNK